MRLSAIGTALTMPFSLIRMREKREAGVRLLDPGLFSMPLLRLHPHVLWTLYPEPRDASRIRARAASLSTRSCAAEDTVTLVPSGITAS